MPLPVENLTPESPIPTIRDMISKSMEQCMSEMMDVEDKDKQKQCAGMIYGIAREKTGKELS